MPRHRQAAESTPEGSMPLLIPMHDFIPDPDLNGYYCVCQLPRQNRHHHDAAMGPAPYFPHTPAADNSPYKPTAHPCTECGAKPGEPCTYNGKPITGTMAMHRSRRDRWTAETAPPSPTTTTPPW